MPKTVDFIEKCGEVWKVSQTHPFVRAIGSGTLARCKFAFYLKQDYLYLIAYSRVLALAVYKAPSLTFMNEFSALLSATLTSEMAMHRSYAGKFGISEDELETEMPSPAMLAYTSYMLDVAARDNFAAIIACLLPCAIGYAEIGMNLKSESEKTGAGDSSNPYQDWIDIYASKEFQEYSAWLSKTFDELTAGADQAESDRLFEVFLTSTRYEWMFWEMAWASETWPI